MAADLTCDLCGQEPAVAMYTSLANGDAMAVGGACLLTFTLTVSAELAKNLPASMRDQYDDVVTGLIDALGWQGALELSPPAPPKRKPGRPRKVPADSGVNLAVPPDPTPAGQPADPDTDASRTSPAASASNVSAGQASPEQVPT